ncbi:MAG: hydrogenase maturation nickel metallochaperone HypA [Candidatus Melainabacteria bacterium]|nr:MAG: hydrogenase maturation nickel metallochaperone HypA [Candidatus Melainabacteria bacterium]
MHEAKIASLILQKASKQIEPYAKALRVQNIELAVGKFRNVDIESLRFAFNALRSDFSLLSEAVLDITEVDAHAYCAANLHEYLIDCKNNFACPFCGSGVGRVSSGQELEIRKIKLETEE